MSDDEHPTDIRPGHFAKRETDRGDKGVLLRLFEALDVGRQQELLRFAFQLSGRQDVNAP